MTKLNNIGLVRRFFVRNAGVALFATTGYAESSLSQAQKIQKSGLVDIKELGAIGNGVSNDAAILMDVANQDYLTMATKGTYMLNASVPIKFMLANDNAIFTSKHLYGVLLNSGSDIRGGMYRATGGVLFNFQTNASNVRITYANMVNMSPKHAIAVNIASNNISNAQIFGNIIQSKDYAILTNSSAADVNGVIIGLNHLHSFNADAIELNAPGKVHTNIVIVGNTLSAGANGENKNSGFAIGVARARGISLVANSIKESRQEAIHFEDEQHTNTVVGNTALNVGGSGYLTGAWSSGLSEGMPVVGNSFRSKIDSNNSGLYMVYDQNGSVPGMALIGNRVVKFKRGIESGSEDILALGNVIEESDDCAIKAIGGGRIFGINMARNCPILIKSYSSTIIDKIVSTTTPTKILDTSNHLKNSLGTVLRGFSYPLNNVHIGSNNKVHIDICSLPLLMRGRMICTVKKIGGIDHIYYSFDIFYDGGNIEISNILKKSFGVLEIDGNHAVILNDSKISFSIFNRSSKIECAVYIDFEGEYYS